MHGFGPPPYQSVRFLSTPPITSKRYGVVVLVTMIVRPLGCGSGSNAGPTLGRAFYHPGHDEHPFDFQHQLDVTALCMPMDGKSWSTRRLACPRTEWRRSHSTATRLQRLAGNCTQRSLFQRLPRCETRHTYVKDAACFSALGQDSLVCVPAQRSPAQHRVWQDQYLRTQVGFEPRTCWLLVWPVIRSSGSSHPIPSPPPRTFVRDGGREGRGVSLL